VSLIGNGKSAVKNHLSPHRKSRLHLVDASTQSDATGFSGDDAADTNPAADVKSAVDTTKVSGLARSTILPTPRA
jgi:hypothetical protein